MSDLKLQGVTQKSLNPTTRNRITLESGEPPDKGRRYLLKRTKIPHLPLIKVRNLLSSPSDHTVINTIRTNSKVIEHLPMYSEVIESLPMNSRLLNKVIEARRMNSRLLSKVIKGLLPNNRQEGNTNVLELPPTTVKYLFDQ